MTRPTQTEMSDRVREHDCPWCGEGWRLALAGWREGVNGEEVWVEWGCLLCNAQWEERFVRPRTITFRILFDGDEPGEGEDDG